MENVEKTYPTRLIRLVCEDIYGKLINTQTWTNWRSWAKVESNKRTISNTEALDIVAIALIRKEDKHKNRELSHTEIKTLSLHPDTQKHLELRLTKQRLKGFVSGKEMKESLDQMKPHLRIDK